MFLVTLNMFAFDLDKGDYVKEDELVAEIETDKTSVEVPAPQAGTIEELLVENGAKVTAKQKLYAFRLGGTLVDN